MRVCEGGGGAVASLACLPASGPASAISAATATIYCQTYCLPQVQLQPSQLRDLMLRGSSAWLGGTLLTTCTGLVSATLSVVRKSVVLHGRPSVVDAAQALLQSCSAEQACERMCGHGHATRVLPPPPPPIF